MNWTVNDSLYHRFIDTYDHHSGLYVSEAIVPTELNGTMLKCCLQTASAVSDICCTTIVNIGRSIIIMIMIVLIIIIL